MGTWNPGPGPTTGDDTFLGDGTDETADGGEGNDTLDGGAGLDSLNGGDGNDILIVAGVTVVSGESYIGGAGTDTLRLSHSISVQEFNFQLATVSSIDRIEFVSTIGDFSIAYFAGSQISAGVSSSASILGSPLIDVFQIFMDQAGALSLAGLTFSNWGGSDSLQIVGTIGADTITGSSQFDIIFGTDGNDTISGLGAADSLSGEAGTDTLNGGDGGDFLYGGQDADSLFGNNGNDLLEGGAGADVLGGGADVDTASYADSTAGVSVDLASGTGSGGYAQGDTLFSIERVIGSALNDTLSGRDYITDTLDGGDGDDVLMGRYGGDILNGGAGIDSIVYTNSLTGVDVRLFNGLAIGGEANGDTYTSIENIIGSATKTDTLAGDDNANSIWGGGGNETITGRDGSDHLFGEAGNDTLLGGAADDFLIGGIGADTLGGGVGNDTADYAASAAGVTVNLQAGTGAGGDAQGDALVSIENVTGSAFNDVIIGKANAWDNVFDGGAGDDTLTGGLGNDTFVYRLAQGSDTIPRTGVRCPPRSRGFRAPPASSCTRGRTARASAAYGSARRAPGNAT
jgi:Ca2+-binding RTX toxin-like protein